MSGPWPTPTPTPGADDAVSWPELVTHGPQAMSTMARSGARCDPSIALATAVLALLTAISYVNHAARIGEVMLDVAILRHLVAHVTYKPGWTLAIHDGRFEGPWLCVRAELPDAYHPDQTTVVDIDTPIPPMTTPMDFLNWVDHRLDRIESHERREWFKVGGIALHDPHADGANHVHSS